MHFKSNGMGQLVKAQVAALNHLIILGITVFITMTSDVFICRNFGRKPQASYQWLPKIAYSPTLHLVIVSSQKPG